MEKIIVVSFKYSDNLLLADSNLNHTGQKNEVEEEHILDTRYDSSSI